MKCHAGGAATFEVAQSAPAFELPDPDMNLVSLADTDAEACESYGVLLDCEVDGNGKKRCLQRPTAIVD